VIEWLDCHKCRLFSPYLDVFFLVCGIVVGIVCERLKTYWVQYGSSHYRSAFLKTGARAALTRLGFRYPRRPATAGVGTRTDYRPAAR